MKNIVLVGILLVVITAGGFYFLSSSEETYQKPESELTTDIKEEVTPTPPSTEIAEPEEVPRGPESTIGNSGDGTPITAYHFGDGSEEILLIGGIHGGYSWNTALLGYELVDWFKANENLVPDTMTVTIIPALNPDGLELVTGKVGRFTASDATTNETTRVAGRFNSNEVDLNRNFDCEWQPEGTWQNRSVSGGSSAFSEPEAQAIRDYVLEAKPAGVVTWYSAAGGVYASACGGEVSTETRAITKLFAEAAGYTANKEFDYYEITGDMVNWFAKENIPAISVLLTNHTATELTKNKAGIEALLNYFK